MIRTVVFDMGNVLFHFSHDRMCQQMGALCGWTGAEMQRVLMDSNWQWDFERGDLEPAELHRRLQDLARREIDPAALVHAASDIFVQNDPLVPVLDELQAAGKRFVLLSNTSVWHYEFLRHRWDLLQRFDELVLSFRVRAIKPEPAIYEAALRVIDCDPDEAFYTDDIARYVTAGRSHGFQAEVFTDAATLRQHLVTHGAL